MSYGMTGGKRQREANRERKKKEKEERLRRNRMLRAQGIDPSGGVPDEPERLPEVSLEDVVSSVFAPREPRRQAAGPTKLFVGGLSWDTGSADLESAFSAFGPLVEATVVTDRHTGRSRGFGFVTFQQPEHAAEAAKKMDGSELDGRMIKVNAAEPR